MSFFEGAPWLMTQPTRTTIVELYCLESLAVLRTLWNYFSPYSVLKDVSRGTVDEKAAAYRHNYEQRGCLLGYIRRWLWTGAFALLLTTFFDSQSPHDGALHIFDLLAAAPALFATVAVCGVMILGYAYVFLSWNEVPTVDRKPARVEATLARRSDRQEPSW